MQLITWLATYHLVGNKSNTTGAIYVKQELLTTPEHMGSMQTCIKKQTKVTLPEQELLINPEHTS